MVEEIIPEIRRVLTIDGGGVKGIIPASLLAIVEEEAKAPLNEFFDLIVGTSTGGVIALGIAIGIPAADILQFYLRHAPAIFPPARGGALGRFGRRTRRRWGGSAGYDVHGFRRLLEGHFGERRLSDALTRVVIPAYETLQNKPYVFKTAHHPRFTQDWKRTCLDVALATAAAPTYFPAHRLEHGTRLVDGGIWANNPVGMAVVEAIGVLRWPSEQLRVLSLGCSAQPFTTPESSGEVGWIKNGLVDLLFEAQSFGSLGTAYLLTGHSYSHSAIHRIQPILPAQKYSLDDTRALKDLQGIGADLARDHMPMIAERFLQPGSREAFVPHNGPRLTG